MLSTSKALVSTAPPRPFSRVHQFDWLKQSRIGCPACRSAYVMAIHRTWYEKLLTRQHKFWCQDCGEKFWKKD